MEKGLGEYIGKNSLIEEFTSSYRRAQTIADEWSSVLYQCFHYAIPFRNRFYKSHDTQGDLGNERIYDTTPVEATKIFVSKFHNSMTPPQTQWGFLEVSPDYVEEKEGERQEMQLELDRYMRNVFKFIHKSNFDVVANECYFDTAIGTACLVINQHTDECPLHFTSIPLDKLSIEEDLLNRIETWYRKWENVKLCELTNRWVNAKLTERLQLRLNEDYNAKAPLVIEGVLYVPKDSKYPYRYCVKVDDEFILEEKLKSKPAIIWRFQKTNAETWGRGPVMDALPSMASLNEMAKIELAAANLNAFRPYMAFSDTIFNPHQFQLKPFAMIPIAPISPGGQPPLMPLAGTSDPQFTQLVMNELRGQIKSLLFNDNANTASIQPTSATEVVQNQQDLAEKIGPLFSRLQQEFIWPTIKRCMFILDEMGILKMPKFNNKDVSFEYRSPLAMAKGQRELAKLAQFGQVTQGLFGPQMAQLYINPIKAPWIIADYMQLDTELLNTPENVQKTIEDMSRRMSEQQEEMANGQQQ